MIRRFKQKARFAAFSQMADGCEKSNKRLEEGMNGISDHLRYGVSRPSSPMKAIGGIFFFFLFAWTASTVCNDAAEKVRETAMQKMREGGGEEDACVRVSETFIRAVGFPSIQKYITYPTIVSSSGDMVLAAETLDLPGCEGKKIKRSRHLAIAVSHGDLRKWPLGLARVTTTFVGELAVCLQHAIEVLDGTITCRSV